MENVFIRLSMCHLAELLRSYCVHCEQGCTWKADPCLHRSIASVVGRKKVNKQKPSAEMVHVGRRQSEVCF